MRNTNGRKDYLAEYTDTVEALPLELQRNYTLIRQLDENVEQLMSQVKTAVNELQSVKTKMAKEERRSRLKDISRLLNDALKKGEEKFALAKTTYDSVDRHCTKLDNDLQRIEEEQLVGPARTNASAPTTTILIGNKRSNAANAKQQKESDTIEKGSSSRGRKSGTSSATTARGRKGGRTSQSKTGIQNDSDYEEIYMSTANVMQHAEAAATMSDLPIDPNEPVYCYCNQVSFGEMVACDNPDCEVEWFHLECVGLRTPPKGKWFCKNCIKHETPKRRRKL